MYQSRRWSLMSHASFFAAYFVFVICRVFKKMFVSIFSGYDSINEHSLYTERQEAMERSGDV